MDPLSDVLALLKLQTFWSAAFDFGGDWSLGVAPDDSIRFYAAISGECWLTVDGVADAVRVRAGDCFLLPRGRAFCVTSDLALTPIDPHTMFPGTKTAGVRRFNGGGDFLNIGAMFTLAGENSDRLLALLPPIVHLHEEPDREALRWCIERMRTELDHPQPGGFLVAQQLAMLVLVQALRIHLADARHGGVGWVFALSDPAMAAAINAMHDDPAGRWTVQSLADLAGMSRTSFTLRFKETVGVSPIEYLTQWRMSVARDRLTNSAKPIVEIARSLGYDSESAFSTAFKRVVGSSPRRYGRAIST